MLKDTIEKFKEKHSGFNFEEFIQSYLDGESRLELCAKYNVSEMPLRFRIESSPPMTMR